MIVYPLYEKPTSARPVTAEMWFWLFSFLNEAFSVLLHSLNGAYPMCGVVVAAYKGKTHVGISWTQFLNFKGLDIWHLDKPTASW